MGTSRPANSTNPNRSVEWKPVWFGPPVRFGLKRNEPDGSGLGIGFALIQPEAPNPNRTAVVLVKKGILDWQEQHKNATPFPFSSFLFSHLGFCSFQASVVLWLRLQRCNPIDRPLCGSVCAFRRDPTMAQPPCFIAPRVNDATSGPFSPSDLQPSLTLVVTVVVFGRLSFSVRSSPYCHGSLQFES